MSSDDSFPNPSNSWRRKFHDAFRGCKRAFRGECNFFSHYFMAALVLVAAAALEANRVEWCLLLACITIVLAAEMFNSSIERLAKAIDSNYNAHLRDALDIAAGGVLTAAIGAAVIGTIILGRLALPTLGVWQ